MLEFDHIRSIISSQKVAIGLPAIRAKLISYGMSIQKIDSLQPTIINFLRLNASNEDLLEVFQRTDKELKETLTDTIIRNRYEKKLMEDGKKIDSHIIFNAQESVSIKEPVVSEYKFTTPINIQDANYTTKEDYPHTHGVIDKGKNWYKINTAKNQAEAVHASLSSIKVDKDGNVTMHITGNLKQVVHGDYTLEVRGNKDIITIGNEYEHISGNVEHKYDGNKKEIVEKDLSQDYQGHMNTKVWLTKKEHVISDVTITYEASKTETVTYDVNESFLSNFTSLIKRNKKETVLGNLEELYNCTKLETVTLDVTYNYRKNYNKTVHEKVKETIHGNELKENSQNVITKIQGNNTLEVNGNNILTSQGDTIIEGAIIKLN